MGFWKKRLVRKTLRDVNCIRTALGKPTLAEMPNGSPMGARSCPIANALDGAKVTAWTTELPVSAIPHKDALKDCGFDVHFLSSEGLMIGNSRTFRRFITRFDHTLGKGWDLQ